MVEVKTTPGGVFYAAVPMEQARDALVQLWNGIYQKLGKTKNVSVEQVWGDGGGSESSAAVEWHLPEAGQDQERECGASVGGWRGE